MVHAGPRLSLNQRYEALWLTLTAKAIKSESSVPKGSLNATVVTSIATFVNPVGPPLHILNCGRRKRVRRQFKSHTRHTMFYVWLQLRDCSRRKTQSANH